MKGRAVHLAGPQKSRLASSSSCDGDDEEELLISSLEGLEQLPLSMARSSTSSRSVTSRGSVVGLLLGATGANSSLSKSKRRWGCLCNNKGRCSNLFLVLSLLLSVSSLLISSLSLASMFPVAGQTTLADKVVYTPCRLFIVGMRSAAWTSRCSDFFLGFPSQFKPSEGLENSVNHGHFYLQPPAASSVKASRVPDTWRDTNSASLNSTIPTPLAADGARTDYEYNSPSVPAPVRMKEKKPRGAYRKVNATRIRPDGRILSDHTITSLYSVRNDFGFRVNYYVFHTLCFNSTHVLLVGPETCLQGWDAAPDSDLTAVACDDGAYVPRRKMLRETHLEEANTTFEWLQQRNVTWWNGTSALIYLDRSSPNVAHFIGKVHGMLAFNNLSVPLFTDFVERVLVLKHDNVWKHFRWRAENFEGFLPVYLADTLSRLLKKRIVPKRLLGNQLFAGDGKIKIGMEWDELIASDHQPMCFEKVVIPGLFKASQYPGRLVTADHVRKNLQDLYLSDDQRKRIVDRELQKAPPLLLYIVRNGRRRTFFPESEHAFQLMLPKTGFEYQMVDFNEMTFHEQFATVQTADISIALHGANLMNPSMFSRRRSVLVEVIPFNVIHRMYETQSMDIGLVYIGHQCLQGSVQQGDEKFSAYKLMDCMQHVECKERFIQQRKIELTARDLTELEGVVSLARDLVLQIDRRGLREKLNSFELLEVVEALVGKGSCVPWLTGIKDMCRGNWVSFMDDQGYYVCYINFFCDGEEDKLSVV